MSKIGIIGYGELGRQIEHHIKCIEGNNTFYYFDDFAKKSGLENAQPFKSFIDPKFRDLDFIIGLGYNHLPKRKEIHDILVEQHRSLLTFIHPTAYIDKSASLMDGCIVYPNVTIDRNVQIGGSCIINLSATIAHDTIIQDCCYISPSVCISGFVEVGNMVFFGSSSSVSNGLQIKDSVVVGIGTVVTKNIDPGYHIIGYPQKVVKKLKLK